MGVGDNDPQGNVVLRYFGMETPEKAGEVLRWAAPYLALLVAGLAGLSFVVQQLQPLSPWVHTFAIVLAALYFFLFMARIRQAGREIVPGPGTGEVDRDGE